MATLTRKPKYVSDVSSDDDSSDDEEEYLQYVQQSDSISDENHLEVTFDDKGDDNNRDHIIEEAEEEEEEEGCDEIHFSDDTISFDKDANTITKSPVATDYSIYIMKDSPMTSSKEFSDLTSSAALYPEVPSMSVLSIEDSIIDEKNHYLLSIEKEEEHEETEKNNTEAANVYTNDFMDDSSIDVKYPSIVDQSNMEIASDATTTATTATATTTTTTIDDQKGNIIVSPLGEEEDNDSFCVVSLDARGEFTYTSEKKFEDMVDMYNTCTNTVSVRTFEHLFQSEAIHPISTIEEEDFKTLSKCQAQASYLNGFLLNESELLDKFKSNEYNYENHASSPFNSGVNFYTLMKQYVDTVIHRAIPHLRKFKILEASLEKRTKTPETLYIFQTKSLTSPACYCGDQNRLTEVVQVTSANLRMEKLAKLKLDLENARNYFYDQVCSSECAVSCCQQTVNHYLQQLFHKNDISHLRHCISILFHFERQTHQNQQEGGDYITRLRNHIRMCIRQCVTQLLKHSVDVDDHRFIIFHVIQSRYVSQWAREFIQISGMQGDICVDVFLAQLSVFLTPVFDPSTNELILLEEDYIQLWDQFPFFDFVDYLLVKSKQNPGSSFYSWDTTFAVLETSLYILSNALQAFNIDSHRNFARQIGHTIVRYVQITTCILFDPSSDAYGHSSFINDLYNSFFVKSFYALLKTNLQLGLWSFLIQLPYDHLFQKTIAALFYNILTLNIEDITETPPQLSDFSNFQDWNQYVQHSSIRFHFARKVADVQNMKRVSSPWFFLIPVIAKLASYSTSINFAAIIAQELFLIGFINIETRQLYFRDMCYAISTICQRHVGLLSMLITLTDECAKKNHQHKAYYHLFKTCEQQIRKWTPSPSDVQILSEWLQHPLDSTLCKVAKLIIDNLGWSYEESNHNLLPHIQRSICLAIVEALSYHYNLSHQSIGWVSYGKSNVDLQQLESFATRIILQAKLQTDMGNSMIISENLTHPSLSIINQHTCQTSLEVNPLIALCTYLLFQLSEECQDFYKMKTETQVLNNLDNMTKEYPDIAIRLLVEIGLRFCKDACTDLSDQINISSSIMQLNKHDAATGTYIGRVMTIRNIVGDTTKKFACSIINHMISELERVHHSMFWLKQFLLVPKWNEDECCTYLMDQICKELLIASHDIPKEVTTLLAQHMGRWNIAEKAPTSFYFFDGRYSFFPKGVFDTLEYSKERPFLTFMFLLGTKNKEHTIRMRVFDSLSKSTSGSMPFIHYNAAQQQSLLTQTLEAVSRDIQARDFVIYRTLFNAVRYSDDLLNVEKKSEERQRSLKENVHAILPLYWQLFFSLYLEVFRTSSDQLLVMGQNFMLVESRVDLFTRIAKLLADLGDFYARQVQGLESVQQKDDRILEQLRLSNRLVSLYRAMSLWSSPSGDPSVMIFKPETLPKTYSLSKLRSFLTEETNLWYDMFDKGSILENKEKGVETLLLSLYPRSGAPTSAAYEDNNFLDVETLKREERSYIKNPPAFDNDILEVRSTIGFNIEQILFTTKKLNKQFLDLTEQTRGLDEALICLIPTLYVNTEKTLTLALKCYKGPFCKEPGTVRFSAVSMQENENTKLQIVKNRDLWSNAMQVKHIAYLRDLACTMVVDIAATIAFQIERNQQQECVDIFFDLLSHFEEIVAAFPPIRDPLVFHILKPIAEQFIQHNSNYTRNLLSIILRENTSKRAEWFADLYDPLCCHEEWPELLNILDSCRREKGAASVYPLFARFSVKKWTQLHSRHNQLVERTIGCCVTMISENNNQAHLKSSEEQGIYTFYMDFLSEILISIPQVTLYHFTTKLVLEKLGSYPKSSKGLADLLSLMSICYNHVNLTLNELRDVESNIRETVRKLRSCSSKNSIYDVCCPSVLNNLINMIAMLFKDVQLNGDISEEMCFDLMYSSFGPFIFIDSFTYPWDLKQSTPAEAQVAADSFVKTLNNLNSSHMIQLAWDMYANLSKMETPMSYIEFITRALESVNWELFERVTLKQLYTMNELLDLPKITPKEQVSFICGVVSRMPWSKLLHLSNFEPHEGPEYYRAIAVLFGNVIARNIPTCNKALEFHIQSLKWADHITNETLNMILHSYFHLMMEFNIKMKDSAQDSIDLMFQTLQRFIKLDPLLASSMRISFKVDAELIPEYNQPDVNRNATLITYMRFLLHLFSVILQKRDKDGELYLYLDKHREGLYGFCVKLILDRGIDLELTQELAKVFNVCQIQLPSFSALTQMTLRLICQKNDPNLCLELMREACNSVGISDQLSLLTETCIRILLSSNSPIFIHNNNNNNTNEEQDRMWSAIFNAMCFNQTSQDYFIHSCTKQGCASSLYAIAMKELVVHRRELKQLASIVNSWIQHIDMLHASQVILMSTQLDLNKDSHVHQDDYLIPLIRMYLDLLVKEDRLRINRKELVGFIETLLKMYMSHGESRVSTMLKSVFSLVFSTQDSGNQELKRYQKHCKRMRWLSALLATFMMSRFDSSEHLMTEHVQTAINTASTATTTATSTNEHKWSIPYNQMLKNMAEIAAATESNGGSQYSSRAVAITNDYINNPERDLKHALYLLDEISPILHHVITVEDQ